MRTIKTKSKIVLNIELEKDNFPNTDNKLELEYHLHQMLKDALNEDRLIIKSLDDTDRKELKFDTIIIS